MEQKQKRKDRFSLTAEDSKTLQELKKGRLSIDKAVYDEIGKAQDFLSKLDIDTADMEKVSQQLSKLDQGLQHYTNYKVTIADLAEGLSDSLVDYVDLANKTKSYKWNENLVRIFFPKKAQRMRTRRVKQQSPKENLQLILDYGENLEKEILEVRENAIKTFLKLEENTDMIVEKIKTYQPKEEAMKERLDKMKEQYAKLEEQSRTASPKEAAVLEDQKNELHKQLTDLQVQYGAVLTKYKQAQELLEASKQSRNAFERMVDDLGRQATMVHEKLENVAEIYAATPEAIKIMMTTKGMAMVDQAINVATDENVRAIITSAEGVSDETLSREQIKAIGEKVMREYIMRIKTMVENFDKTQNKIRLDARRSQAERYGVPDNTPKNN